MEKDVYKRMGEQENDHWWFTSRRAIIRSLLEQYRPVGKSLKILEAGCGTGGNLALLGEFGHVEAFEMDEEAVQHSRLSGVAVEQGSLPDAIPFGSAKYDVIALFDVLEHVEQDEASIRALSRLLKPGGRLFITVPAHPRLWSHHDVRHHHFRRYTKTSLKQLLEKNGMHPIRLSYYNFFLFPVLSSLRVAKNLLRNKGNDEEMPPGWLNSILFKTFSSERHALSRMNLPVGLSLVAVVENTHRHQTSH